MFARHVRRINGARSMARGRARRGIVIVTSAVLITVLLGFVAFTVDSGQISLTKAKMQNAVDAASLAAAEEIVTAVNLAGAGSASGSVAEAIEASARTAAAEVAAANGVFVDPDQDVTFGARVFDAATGQWSVQWNEQPYNVVRVNARRDQPDTSLPDGRLKLAFAWVLGVDSAEITTDSAAFIPGRDLVLVLDYSGSMSYDSQFRGMSYQVKSSVEANMDDIWNSLVTSGTQFSNTGQLKFPATGLGAINSPMGTYQADVYNSYGNLDEYAIVDALGLTQTNADGSLKYPFPQEGKYSSGDPKGQPSASTSRTMWRNYVHWVRTDSDVSSQGYRRQYGYRTLMGYLLEARRLNNQSEDLWRTPHYPFNAMKEGVSMFFDFLDDLQFGDHVGLVNYATTANREEGVYDPSSETYIDLEGVLITDDYASLDTIQRRKQAAHYSPMTALGDGIKVGRELLLEQRRFGVQPVLIVMTDGNANQRPGSWSPPGGWDWNSLTDYDDDGLADYSTGDWNKWYAFWEAKKAIDEGIQIHTLSVGADADGSLMEAIAHAGRGIWVNVPGGTSVGDVQDDVIEAFRKIAGQVPPPSLINPNSNSN